MGASTLLVDEDTCATNFMIRDRRMCMLVSNDKEPITPFIAKVGAMRKLLGTSTIMVVGASGDFFAVADTVLALDCYTVKDVTDKAKQIMHEVCGDRALRAGRSVNVLLQLQPSAVTTKCALVQLPACLSRVSHVLFAPFLAAVPKRRQVR